MTDREPSQTLNRLFGFHGKTVIVTGGGAGIGKAIVKLFSDAGAGVVVADRDGQSAQAVATALAERGRVALGVAADVGEEASVVAMVDQTVATLGVPDVLVNNAGIYPHQPLDQVTREQWENVHRVNGWGTFACIRQVARAMRASGHGGRIVNVSSMAAIRNTALDLAAYGSSKAGVDAITRTTALELAADGIAVNAVQPGVVGVPLAVALARPDLAASPLFGPGRIPLGREAMAGDIAAAVLFLASDAAGYITGQTLAVDGGFSIS